MYKVILSTFLVTALFIGNAVTFKVGIPNSHSFQERIIGGSNVPDNTTYPFMVSLRYMNYDSHSCGGSIITKRTVLTAAHCLFRTNASNVVIVAGTNYWNTGGTRYPALALISHRDYNETDVSNDIGLVIVTRDIEFTPRVQPISYTARVISEVDAFVIGWGTTSAPNGNLSPVLKYLDTKTTTNQVCKGLVGELSDFIFDSSLCVDNAEGESPCNSDSGGPIIYNNTVIGLVSWGMGCASGLPVITTRVSSFYTWINTNRV